MARSRRLIEYATDDAIAVITLNRPEARNAQNRQLLAELDEAWMSASEDEAVRVIVLKANGPHFSAGHDLKREPGDESLYTIGGGIANGYRYETATYLETSRRWRDVPKPSIAAVQGACIAHGLRLVWPCDLIVASEDAWFADPVVRLGIGGIEYHAHTWELGPRKAKELLFTAGRLTAQEAYERGMVNRVVRLDDLTAAVMGLAREIAEMDPFALAQAKRAVNLTLDIMGQYAAMQAAFDIHVTGHAHALALTGQAGLTDLEGMKEGNRRFATLPRGQAAGESLETPA